MTTESTTSADVPAGGPRDRLDRPLRDLRISVTDRCNFRCPYCMPRERYHEHYEFLKTAERLGFEEIVRLARLFVALGVRKFRITGGEPLLRPALADLIGDLSTLRGVDDIALTTNGMLLAQHAVELRAAGLQRATVSLDSLDPAVFARMAGGFGSPQEVLAGIDAAQRAGLAPIKINAVVQRGLNDHTILDLIEHFRGTQVVVRLIEYMDVGNRNDWKPEEVVPSRELLDRIGARWPLLPAAAHYRGEVARRYVFQDGARLSSDGRLYGCLFATEGMDLRGPLRAGQTDEELLGLIRGFWERRADRYSEQRVTLHSRAVPRVEMNHIGG
jgi:cyclic pyranopterin phosphate synthase